MASAPNTPDARLAVAYIRTSTDKQDVSPEVQRERIGAYCAMGGLMLADVIVETVSGKTRFAKRPSNGRLAALIAQGVRHIVALKLDRVFRKAADALATVDKWSAAGISLHIVDLNGTPLDTTTSMGRRFFAELNAFAEFERNFIAERITAAVRHKRAHDKVYGNTPYGFDAVDGRLVQNRAKQAVLVTADVAHLWADEIAQGEVGLIDIP